MPELMGIVLEQGAATRQLLHEIEIQRPTSRYNRDLLVFLGNLCEILNKEIAKASAQVVADSASQAALRRLVIMCSSALCEVHRLCQYFDHTDNLSVCVPMMQLLNKLGKDISQGKPFILRGDFEYTYSYYPLGRDLHRLAKSISSEAVPISEHFACFAFPIAKKGYTLPNCALVHELGHLIVDANDLIGVAVNKKPDLSGKIDDILKSRAAAGDQLDFDIIKRTNQASRVLENWMHEVLADLIGMHLLGPAHLFAFMHFIGHIGVYQRDDPEHPCSAYRMKLMLKAARVLGWESTLQETPMAWQEAQRIAQLPRESGNFRFDAADQCLPIIEPALFELAGETCRSATYKPKVFASEKDQMLSLLSHGIPPVEVLVSRQGKRKFRVSAPVTILNVGWFCYESSFPGWDQKFPKLTTIERGQVLDRLIIKAMEISFVKSAESKARTRRH